MTTNPLASSCCQLSLLSSPSLANSDCCCSAAAAQNRHFQSNCSVQHHPHKYWNKKKRKAEVVGKNCNQCMLEHRVTPTPAASLLHVTLHVLKQEEHSFVKPDCVTSAWQTLLAWRQESCERLSVSSLLSALGHKPPSTEASAKIFQDKSSWGINVSPSHPIISFKENWWLFSKMMSSSRQYELLSRHMMLKSSSNVQLLSL